jgi:hypothetical protein
MSSADIWGIAAWLSFFGIFALVLRNTVRGYQLAGGRPSPRWQQRLLIGVVVIFLLFILSWTLTLPWVATVLSVLWIGFNMVFVPRTVTWGTVIGYSVQVFITGIIMMVAAMIVSPLV